MNESISQQLKDFVYNVNAFLHWRDEFIASGDWTDNKNMSNHLCRVRELLPVILDWLREHDFDDLCG